MDQNYLDCHWKVAISCDEEMIIYSQIIEMYCHPQSILRERF